MGGEDVSEALKIIQSEHRNFMKILDCLERAAGSSTTSDTVPDIELASTSVAYAQSFMDHYHHPKEHDFLFHALSRRHPNAKELLRQLDAEHRDGAALLRKLKSSLQDYNEQGSAALGPFRDAVRDYIAFERSHCQKEELRVLPLAREHLTEFDWLKIDTAFQSRTDPVFGEQVRDNFKRLYDEIVPIIA